MPQTIAGVSFQIKDANLSEDAEELSRLAPEEFLCILLKETLSKCAPDKICNTLIIPDWIVKDDRFHLKQLVVARIDGKIVGYAYEGEFPPNLGSRYVLPEFRGMGIGTQFRAFFGSGVLWPSDKSKIIK